VIRDWWLVIGHFVARHLPFRVFRPSASSHSRSKAALPICVNLRSICGSSVFVAFVISCKIYPFSGPNLCGFLALCEIFSSLFLCGFAALCSFAAIKFSCP
jgi:hypothetical protein